MSIEAPTKLAAESFHVCCTISAGAEAVSVPLLAVSVVNAPLFGVVEPMAGGDAASKPAPNSTPVAPELTRNT